MSAGLYGACDIDRVKRYIAREIYALIRQLDLEQALRMA
jgi:hypothetical protein